MARPVRISVIGAGSGVFSLGLVKDLCLTPNLRESEVAFMDLNPERLDIVHSLAVRYADELGSRLRFEKTTDRAAALRDADFVINTASARTHHAQRRERELTAEHGYYGYLDMCSVLGLDPARVTWEAPGLNHCIWLTQFLYDGQNAYPILDEWIEQRAEEHWRTHRAESTHDT